MTFSPPASTNDTAEIAETEDASNGVAIAGEIAAAVLLATPGHSYWGPAR